MYIYMYIYIYNIFSLNFCVCHKKITTITNSITTIYM